LEKGTALRIPVALLAGLLATAATVLPAAPAAAGAQSDAIAELNEVRRASGLAELRRSPSLERSSTRYARHMIRSDYFGHAARIAVGSEFDRAGETLALHSGWSAKPAQTVASWMRSAGHRGVLMSSRFGWIGMGIARGRIGSELVTVWVAQVGARG
jgi:uncharacterized protein YkwD